MAAPMAGISSPAHRLMAKAGGASLVFTEMVSAAGMMRGLKKTWALARVLPEERPVALQLFGGDPEVLALATAKAGALPVDAIDLNMGCPAKKVRRQRAGSALLDEPGLAFEAMAAVAENCPQPVTVKLRLGYARDELESLVPGLVKAGAQAVILHARTVKQGFAGQADWPAVARLVSWCPVPVIGNGDVRSDDDAVRMLGETGCAGVMIGRGAIGDPWIFGRARERLAGRPVRQVSVAVRKEALFMHAKLAQELGGRGHALHFLRKFMMMYTKGLPGAVTFRRAAGPVNDPWELWRLSDEFFDQLEAAG